MLLKSKVLLLYFLFLQKSVDVSLILFLRALRTDERFMIPFDTFLAGFSVLINTKCVVFSFSLPVSFNVYFCVYKKKLNLKECNLGCKLTSI